MVVAQFNRMPMPEPAGAQANAESAAAMPTVRERFQLREAGAPTLALQVQRNPSSSGLADVVYVHGGTFGSDMSVFFPLGGRSWADELSAAGLTVWGFDFAGYGLSDRYPQAVRGTPGDMTDSLAQLHRAVTAVRLRNGGRAVALLGHSHGATVAARYAGDHPGPLSALVLFAPILARPAGAVAAASGTPPSHYPLTIWAQYRRFIEDAPRGSAPLIDDADIEAWSAAFLDGDSSATSRMPRSVRVPSGPLADIGALWSGRALYDPARIVAPTLLVRGQWDSLCSDADAARLMDALGAQRKADVKIERATHLMHLEMQRRVLYEQVQRFLLEVL